MTVEALAPPVQSREIHVAQVGDIGYRMYATSRFFHIAGLARVSDSLLRATGEGRATLQVEDYTTKTKSTFTVVLDRPYVYSLKNTAFRAYLALYDLGEEGIQIGRDVMYNLRGESKDKIKLVDKLDG